MIRIELTRSHCIECKDVTTFVAIDGGVAICSRSHRPDERDSMAQLQRCYDDAASDNSDLRRRLAEAKLEIEMLQSQLLSARRKEPQTRPDLLPSPRSAVHTRPELPNARARKSRRNSR